MTNQILLGRGKHGRQSESIMRGVHPKLGGNMEVTENSLRWRLTTHYLGLLLGVNWAVEGSVRKWLSK